MTNARIFNNDCVVCNTEVEMTAPYVTDRSGGNFRQNDDTVRFQVELEFVQCLSNPNYLNFLAQRGYFKESTFVNYLKYLLYWKEPRYVKYLRYPQCLHMLELLQYESFRNELVNTPCAKYIEDQMLLHWQYYTRKRVRLQQALMESIRERSQKDNRSTASVKH